MDESPEVRKPISEPEPLASALPMHVRNVYSIRLGVLLLIGLGLLFRLAGGFLYGTQDMEWWKAFGSFTSSYGISQVYSTVPDREIVRLLSAGTPRDEVRQLTQRHILFHAYDYGRTDYVMPQPPAYIYPIHGSVRLYQLFSPNLENKRLFNWFLNLEPTISSALLAIAIGLFVGHISSQKAGITAGLVYWLNPLVLLNSPIQGFRDPMMALFATLSIIFLYRRNLTLAIVCLVASFMTKPQAVLILPVVVICGIYEHSWKQNLKALLAGGATAVLICSPYIITGHFLGLVLGVTSITDASADLSRQSLNFWWPVQYVVNAYALHTGGQGIVSALLGSNMNIFRDYPIAKFAAETGINPKKVGLLLYLSFTIFNLWFTRRILRIDRRMLFVAAAMQVYSYFILSAGVQNNHYFLIVPLLTIAWACGLLETRFAVFVGVVFFAQDFIFYGLGRDWNIGRKVLIRTFLGWLTVVLALMNCGLFLALAVRCWRLARAGVGSTIEKFEFAKANNG